MIDVVTACLILPSPRLTRNTVAWRLISMVCTRECFFWKRRNMQLWKCYLRMECHMRSSLLRSFIWPPIFTGPCWWKSVQCVHEQAIERKGLDMVRRDWSLLSKEIGDYCLSQILSGGYGTMFYKLRKKTLFSVWICKLFIHWFFLVYYGFLSIQKLWRCCGGYS